MDVKFYITKKYNNNNNQVNNNNEMFNKTFYNTNNKLRPRNPLTTFNTLKKGKELNNGIKVNKYQLSLDYGLSNRISHSNNLDLNTSNNTNNTNNYI